MKVGYVLSPELVTNRKTIISEDGRYEITYPENCEGWAQIAEYQGSGPRVRVGHTSVPMELLNAFLDTIRMNAAPAAY